MTTATTAKDGVLRRPARTQATRQKLFAAAMELIGQRGASEVSVDEIAAAAGVSKGTVYYNFGSKNELITQLLQQGMDLLLESLRPPRGEKDVDLIPDAEPLAEISGMVERALVFIGDYPAFIRLWLSEQWRPDGNWQELLSEMRGIVLEEIRASVQRVADIAPLRSSATPETLTTALFGAAFVVGINRMNGSSKALEECRDAVMSFAAGAFAFTPGTATSSAG